MKCKECGTEMKPLFVGEFCPNDCDKPEVLAKRKAEVSKAAIEEAVKKLQSAPVVHPHPYFLVPQKAAQPGPVNFGKIKKDTSKSPVETIDDIFRRIYGTPN